MAWRAQLIGLWTSLCLGGAAGAQSVSAPPPSLGPPPPLLQTPSPSLGPPPPLLQTPAPANAAPASGVPSTVTPGNVPGSAAAPAGRGTRTGVHAVADGNTGHGDTRAVLGSRTSERRPSAGQSQLPGFISVATGDRAPSLGLTSPAPKDALVNAGRPRAPEPLNAVPLPPAAAQVGAGGAPSFTGQQAGFIVAPQGGAAPGATGTPAGNGNAFGPGASGETFGPGAQGAQQTGPGPSLQ